MKIVPFISVYAPEQSYFTVNGVKFNEPWARKGFFAYPHAQKEGVHPIGLIRQKYFKPASAFCKVLTIDVRYPEEVSYLNKVHRGVINSYEEIKGHLETLATKHNINGDMMIQDLVNGGEKPMPLATYTMKIESKFLS